VLPFDRVLGIGKDAVLYADPTSASFGPFHEVLSKAAKQGDISYRLRYRRSTAQSSPLPVSGYGVELALKRTDYIVIDDREAGKDATQKPVATDVVLNEEEEVADLKPLSTSELASLGLKTASFILKSENPFETLVKATQDFPKFSRSIIAHEISKEFKEEQQKNVAAGVPTGINFLWMNGVQLIERQIEPFNLIDMIRRERKLINGVRALGFNGQQAVSLLGHSQIANAKADDEPTRFDWTDRSEDGKVFIWLNDLEKDTQYAELPKELKAVCITSFGEECHSSFFSFFDVPIPASFPRWLSTSSTLLRLSILPIFRT
jgi:UDP-glucose:glycoprotein glucosyltransferase